MARRVLIYLTTIAMVGVVALPWTISPMRLTKLAWLAAMGIAWAGSTALCWKRRRIRTGLLVSPLAVTIPFLLPGRAIDPAELRNDYVRRMGRFEGTTYVWGGESRRGIDCSGLPRRAYRDALLSLVVIPGSMPIPERAPSSRSMDVPAATGGSGRK